MSENVFFAALFFPAAAFVLIFFMKYLAAVLQARARMGHDDAYRELARQAAQGQAATLAALAAQGEVLAELRTRIGALEKILKEVE
jgi:hypothetical protein